MENGWNLFNFNTTTTTTTPTFGNKGHNSNNTPSAWDVWESGSVPPETTSSRIDWGSNSNNFINPHSNSSANEESAAADFQTLMGNYDHARFYGEGGGGGSHYFPDPHLMCLKLGKRNYFGVGDRQAAAAAVAYNSITKKGKPYYEVGGGGGDGGISVNEGNSTSASGVTVASLPAAVPRCQVDGCNVALVNAKDYHKRHKVCEMHSKAPKVVVLGVEQRFCQQCSRFHAVSEFDESKRSCRRRLAGHNERRRKSSHQLEHSAISRNHSQSHVNSSKLMSNYRGRNPYIPPLNSGCALSLLSSKSDHNSSFISSTDLPTRCSAALRELIAENRASILARQLIFEHWNDRQPAEDHLNGRHQIMNNYQQQISNNWDRIGEVDEDGDGHVTLDLMQAPNSAFGLLSMRGKSKEDDQECPGLWSSFGGAHVL